MEKGDKKQHWEMVYSRNDPANVSWYQDEPHLSINLIKETGIGKHANIIDIGGGASKLVNRLDGAGYRQISVLDISANSLEYSRNQMAARQNLIEWHEADVTQFHPQKKYELWHDRAVFHFLTQKDDREKYLQVLGNALAAQGHVILAAFAIGGPQKCSGLDIIQYDSDKLLGEFGNGFSLVDEIPQIHITPSGGEQKFSFFHLIQD